MDLTQDIAVSKSKVKGKVAKKKKPTPAVKKTPPPARSPICRGKEPSEWADILFLNNGDNEMANFTQDALNKKYNLTVTPVSSKSQIIFIICVNLIPERLYRPVL